MKSSLDTDRAELERFKKDINLIEFVASYGFTKIDREKSSKICVVVEQQKNGQKIGISRDRDGHWVYYDFYQEKGGSIIDFMSTQSGYTLGQIRKELRNVLPDATTFSFPTALFSSAATSNRQKVLCEYRETKPCSGHPYLLQRKVTSHAMS